jgi:hypothetical protein
MAQPGKFAGSMKSFIGKTFTDVSKISGLTGWKFQEGSLLTGIDDPEVIIADVYKKGTTIICIFSIKEDTADKKYTIADILEVKNVPHNQHVITGLCRQGENESTEIVALAKVETTTETSKAIKAWRFNRDKRRLETQNIKGVTCMNEVD